MVSRENQVFIILSAVVLVVLLALRAFTNLSTVGRIAVVAVALIVAYPLINSFDQ